LFHTYRTCATEIWNRFFVKGEDPYQLPDSWDRRDRWADACTHLFRALVLYPLDLDEEKLMPEYWGEIQPLLYFHVEPNGVTEILINTTTDAHCGIWSYKHPTEAKTGDFDLRFRVFFDWDSLNSRSFEWVETLIVESAKFPETAGRRALVRTDN